MRNGGCRNHNKNHDTVNMQGYGLLICVLFIFMRLVVMLGDGAGNISTGFAVHLNGKVPLCLQSRCWHSSFTSLAPRL